MVPALGSAARRACARGHEPGLVREDDRLDAVAEAELGEHVGDVTAGVTALGIRGWRFPAGCAAASAAIFGTAAVLFPGQESSPGAGWGAVAIVWAVTVAAVTWLAEPASDPSPATA